MERIKKKLLTLKIFLKNLFSFKKKINQINVQKKTTQKSDNNNLIELAFKRIRAVMMGNPHKYNLLNPETKKLESKDLTNEQGEHYEYTPNNITIFYKYDDRYADMENNKPRIIVTRILLAENHPLKQEVLNFLSKDPDVLNGVKDQKITKDNIANINGQTHLKVIDFFNQKIEDLGEKTELKLDKNCKINLESLLYKGGEALESTLFDDLKKEAKFTKLITSDNKTTYMIRW
jgi:hypothetical protein